MAGASEATPRFRATGASLRSAPATLACDESNREVIPGLFLDRSRPDDGGDAGHAEHVMDLADGLPDPLDPLDVRAVGPAAIRLVAGQDFPDASTSRNT